MSDGRFGESNVWPCKLKVLKPNCKPILHQERKLIALLDERVNLCLQRRHYVNNTPTLTGESSAFQDPFDAPETILAMYDAAFYSKQDLDASCRKTEPNPCCNLETIERTGRVIKMASIFAGFECLDAQMFVGKILTQVYSRHFDFYKTNPSNMASAVEKPKPKEDPDCP